MTELILNDFLACSCRGLALGPSNLSCPFPPVFFSPRRMQFSLYISLPRSESSLPMRQKLPSTTKPKGSSTFRRGHWPVSPPNGGDNAHKAFAQPKKYICFRPNHALGSVTASAKKCAGTEKGRVKTRTAGRETATPKIKQ